MFIMLKMLDYVVYSWVKNCWLKTNYFVPSLNRVKKWQLEYKNKCTDTFAHDPGGTQVMMKVMNREVIMTNIVFPNFDKYVKIKEDE